MNEDRNDEFEAREKNIPIQLGALIHSFLSELTDAEYKNRMDYAKFIQTIIAFENAKWGVDIGILTMDQALSIMASLPIIELVNTDYLGVTEAEQVMEFRVSASRKNSDKLTAHAESQTKVGTGGLAGLLGASGSCSISAGTTYQRDNRRESDYSSTVKTTVKVGRLSPPETVAFMGQVTQDTIKAGMDINRMIIEQQKEQLTADAQDADVPQSIAEESSSSGGSGGGGGSQPAAAEE